MEHIQGGDSNYCGGGSTDEIVEMRASLFVSLPVDCISKIISRTTPRDACVMALVSKTFKSAAQSDLVWEKFLPPEYASLIPPSLNYSSKKDIYLSLADYPVLIGDGKKSFWLEKSSGKKCYMLSAMDFTIFWGNNPLYWEWVSVPDSKFEKVAHVSNVCRLKFRCKISCGMLSKGTHYSVYVVFKKGHTWRIAHDSNHTPVEADVGFVGKEYTKTLVFLETEWESAQERGDWWHEVELGKFYINNGGSEDGSDEIEISLKEIDEHQWKTGLLIQGIEIRPEIRN